MKLLPVGIACLLATSLSAQVAFEQCGSLNNTEETGFQRQGGVGNSVAYDAMISSDDFRGWGFQNIPGTESESAIAGVRVLLGDVDSSTSEEVDIWIYPESSAVPNSPDFGAPIAGWSFTLFGTGNPNEAQAAIFDIMFPSPASVVSTSDVFLEVYLDGVRAPEIHIGLLDGDVVAGSSFDIGNARTSETGHGLGAAGGYTYIFDINQQLAFFEESQLLITPTSTDQAGFTVGAQTSQASLPSSNSPGKTASFFSALHPCDTVDRNGAARADNVGWFFNGPFTSVFDQILIRGTTTGFLGTPIDLSLFLPGSIGGLCLDTTLPFLDFGSMTPNPSGLANSTLVIPAGARGGIAGFTFAFQAFVLNTTAMTIHASGCVQQRW